MVTKPTHTVRFIKLRSLADYTCNGSGASDTSLSEELSKAVSTIWFIIPRCEALSSKACITVAAAEALSVPRLISICYTSTRNYLNVNRLINKLLNSHILKATISKITLRI